MQAVLIGLLLGASAQAQAQNQNFQRDPSWHLAPQAGTYTQNGIGSPTVVYREKHGDYVMFFESRIANADADCTVGTWGISWATSPDGLNWTVAPTQQFPNTDGTYYECVAAHPYAVMDDNGDDIHLWFKGEQGTQACDNGAKAWGCQQYTGVGYAKFNEDLVFVESSPEPVLLENFKFGFPAVVRDGDTWYMMVARYPSFYLATSTSPDSGWTIANNSVPVMQPGVTSWSQDELFNPSLVCDDQAQFGFTNWFGGRNYGSTWPIIDAGGWGNAISDSATAWFLGSISAFNWSGDDKWRHWDTIKAGDDTLVWFSEKQGGKNHVGFASTTQDWNPADLQSRLCPATDRWGLVSPSSDFVQAADWYRDYLQDFADGSASTCAANIINNDIQPLVTEELMFEFIKGHPHHMAEDGFDEILDELDDIQSDCGDDVASLKAQLASLAIHGLTQLADRATLIAGPNDRDILRARADIQSAQDAFLAGDYTAAITAANSGLDTLDDDVDYAGNFCTGAETETYAAITCTLLDFQADAQALYDATGNHEAEEALEEIGEAVEESVMPSTKDVAKKLADAGEELADVGTADADALLQDLAQYSEVYVRQFINDATVSGHANADIAEAEAFFTDAVTLLNQGDYVGALEAFKDAAKEAKG